MKMNSFNDESEPKAEPDPLKVVPQSLSAKAGARSQPTKPDAGRPGAPHHRAYAQMSGARAYLDPGSKISGELKFEGPVQIEGRIDGEINAKADLLIGESAVVTAQIKAPSIVVSGKLNGSIIASERIEIRPSARVSGDITTPNLVVHEDATFEGHCAMQSGKVRDERTLGELRKDDRTAGRASGGHCP